MVGFENLMKKPCFVRWDPELSLMFKNEGRLVALRPKGKSTSLGLALAPWTVFTCFLLSFLRDQSIPSEFLLMAISSVSSFINLSSEYVDGLSISVS